MPFYLIALIIFLIYFKTLNYHYVIDDYVRREGYLWNVPKEGQNPTFYDTKPTKKYRLFMIGMHIVNTFLIYTLWGWQGALLFAVHPMSVWGVAWVTGNYYATTAYFTLISYFFITQILNPFGLMAGAIFFLCALNSTADAMSFPFLFLMTGNWLGCITFLPLIYFMNGKRWVTGFGTRKEIVKGKQVDIISWDWRRPFFMTKVMARYIETFFFPRKFYFFGPWAERIRESKAEWDFYHAPNKEFWISLLICFATFISGMMIHPTATLWFFVLMGIHSQFTVLGQPFAQRYLYLPQVGLCVVVGTLFINNPAIIYALAGFYVCRSFTVLPNWQHQEDLLLNETTMHPERGSGHSAIAQYYISRKKLIEYPPWKINEISSHMRRAAILQPENWVISMNFCAYLVMIGKIDEAIAANERTIMLMEKYATEREKPGIPGAVKQLEWLKNLRVEAKRQAKLAQKANDRRKGKK